MEEVEAQSIPVWNELIAEGMVESHGYFVHAWASEYNVGIYTIGESIASIIAAVEESGQRLEELYGDGPSAFGEACPHHRDGFYVLGPSAGGTTQREATGSSSWRLVRDRARASDLRGGSVPSGPIAS